MAIKTDSLGNQSTIVLTSYGKVEGFGGYKAYAINIDLNSDPMDNLDEISFDRKAKASYTFKINKDTVNLYDTYPNADSTELNVGRLKYKLVKIK